jgi:hypothetical protein
MVNWGDAWVLGCAAAHPRWKLEHPVVVLFFDHASGFAPFLGADDPVLFHLFDESGGLVETDAQSALDQGNGRLAMVHDKAYGLAVFGIVHNVVS